MLRILSIVLIVLMVLLFPPSALAFLSQNALPGESMYPVKRSLESGILLLSSLHPTSKAYFSLAQSQSRFKETEGLFAKGSLEHQNLDDFVSQTNTAAVDVRNVKDLSQRKKLIDSLSESIDSYDKSFEAVIKEQLRREYEANKQKLSQTNGNEKNFDDDTSTVSTPPPSIKSRNPSDTSPKSVSTPKPSAENTSLPPTQRSQQVDDIEDARRKLEEIKRQLQEELRKAEEEIKNKQSSRENPLAHTALSPNQAAAASSQSPTSVLIASIAPSAVKATSKPAPSYQSRTIAKSTTVKSDSVTASVVRDGVSSVVESTVSVSNSTGIIYLQPNPCVYSQLNDFCIITIHFTTQNVSSGAFVTFEKSSQKGTEFLLGESTQTSGTFVFEHLTTEPHTFRLYQGSFGSSNVLLSQIDGVGIKQ